MQQFDYKQFYRHAALALAVCVVAENWVFGMVSIRERAHFLHTTTEVSMGAALLVLCVNSALVLCSAACGVYASYRRNDLLPAAGLSCVAALCFELVLLKDYGEALLVLRTGGVASALACLLLTTSKSRVVVLNDWTPEGLVVLLSARLRKFCRVCRLGLLGPAVAAVVLGVARHQKTHSQHKLVAELERARTAAAVAGAALCLAAATLDANVESYQPLETLQNLLSKLQSRYTAPHKGEKKHI